MDGYSLDLSLEITQGAIHNLGDLFLLYRLWANTYLPTGEAPKAVVVVREDDWSLAPHEARVEHAATDRVVQLLRDMGLPQRRPEIEAASGNPTGWQRLAFWCSLNGASGCFSLDLQCGGAQGRDAATFRALLEELLLAAGLGAEHARLRIV